jgi:hypothetical protein
MDRHGDKPMPGHVNLTDQGDVGDQRCRTASMATCVLLR